jgi:alkanesulfonate monooxygenase SsuD/methylene tetrahydromethanopterin reductase-like flavin-dependent oxidoreductase (luciferase family)
MRKLRFGLWYDFRNPPQWRQDPSRLYEAILAQAARAEALGWDDVWLSEHHFIEDGYTPSMLPLAAAIAARTKRIRVGTSVLLLPLHDPLRVAEDAATIDIVSNGRFDLGVGAGYRVGEFDGFAIPRRERDGRMAEAVEVLRRAFSGERFTFEGKYYRYRDVQLSPLPVQKPMPIRLGGFLPKAIERAGRVGDGYISIGSIRPLVDKCLEAVRASGRDPESYEVAGGFPWLLVARDPERRWKEALPHFLYQLNLYARWYSEAGMSLVSAASNREELERMGFFILRPERAVERIREYVAANRVTRFYGWTVPPGLPPEWSDEHLELMAKEVMAAFR